jgi:hypothetical protein
MALDPFAPIRLGVRAGIGLIRFELRLIEHVLGLDREQPEPVDLAREPIFTEPEPFPGEPEPIFAEPEPEPEPRPTEPEREEAPPPAASMRIEPERRRIVEPDEPQHIDDEPELVAEFAEPGAEEGAGPEIHVDEPWGGYRKMRVADIRDRVTVANPAELTVVRLYESANRGRRSVLDAVERRTRELANAPR